MGRGRPSRSIIRQRVVELLQYLGRGCGYELAKHYNKLFSPVTQRSIYYHLRKGTQTGELEVQEITEEKGEYSWGNRVEKIYYIPGPQASPLCDVRVQEYFTQQGITPWQPSSRKKFMRFVPAFRREK